MGRAQRLQAGSLQDAFSWVVGTRRGISQDQEESLVPPVSYNTATHVFAKDSDDRDDHRRRCQLIAWMQNSENQTGSPAAYDIEQAASRSGLYKQNGEINIKQCRSDFGYLADNEICKQTTAFSGNFGTTRILYQIIPFENWPPEFKTAFRSYLN